MSSGTSTVWFRRYRGYLYVAPLLIVLGLIVVYPVLYNTGIAFFEYRSFSDQWVFSGLENFTKLFASPYFWMSFRTTLVWVLGNVALQFVIGLGVALAVNRLPIGRGFLGGLFLVPWISSYVIVAVLWLWVYHPQLGVLNDILLKLGLISRPIMWLTYPQLARVSLIITNSWKFFPLVMITLMAGLQGIQREFFEVAQVEGAGRWQTLRYVIIPNLLPSISSAVLVSTIWAFNGFTLPFIMTGGGPLRFTELLGLFIYKQAFVSYDFGAAAAGCIFLFLQISIVIYFYLRVAGKERV